MHVTKRRTMIRKTLHRKLKVEQFQPHLKIIYAALVTPLYFSSTCCVLYSDILFYQLKCQGGFFHELCWFYRMLYKFKYYIFYC